jgi:hypothetical protein
VDAFETIEPRQRVVVDGPYLPNDAVTILRLCDNPG